MSESSLCTDRQPEDSRHFQNWISVLLLVEGALVLTLSLFLVPQVVEVFRKTPLEPLGRFQVHVTQFGVFAVGLLASSWGFYELVTRRRGPLILLSLALFCPVVFTFYFVGYGSDPDAWSLAHAAQQMHPNGGYRVNGHPGPPLYQLVARLVVPRWSWPGLLLVNTLAGFGGALVWLGLPSEIPAEKRRLVVLGILVQPLFLLGCGTGLEFIWQMAFLGTAAVLLVRGLAPSRSGEWGWILVSGVATGLACGFSPTSLAALPVLLAAVLFGRGTWRWKTVGVLLYAAIAGGVALLCQLPVLLACGAHALKAQSEAAPDPLIAIGQILRFVIPPPAVVLAAIALLHLVTKGRSLSQSERPIVGVSLGLVLVFLTSFFLVPSKAACLTLLVPFFAALWGMLVPRVWHCLCLPALAVWCFLSLPLAKAAPEGGWKIDLNPSPGPLVEESIQRFRMMQRAQQILMAMPKKKTAVVVGDDWPVLATLRPLWVIDDLRLENPEAPVEFYDWIDPERFSRMKEEGYQFLVVGGADRLTKAKFGYDLFEQGAREWTPKMRFYR